MVKNGAIEKGFIKRLMLRRANLINNARFCLCVCCNSYETTERANTKLGKIDRLFGGVSL